MKLTHYSQALAVILLTLTLASAKSLNENVTSESGTDTSTVQIEELVQNANKTEETSSTVSEKVRRLNLDYGQLRQEPERDLPEPVMISSQPIVVNTRKTAGSIGVKRGRSILPEDASDGVKVIEGVRVPDNEEDKFHTWRNARVIKGMLVPKNRSPQPHKKRQIMVQDATQYLAAHGLSVPQFQQLYQQQQQQQQQQSPILDPALLQAMAQAQASPAPQQQNVFYNPQQQQQQYYSQDMNTGAIYATASPLSAKNFQQISPMHSMHAATATAVPVVLQPDGQIYSQGNGYHFNSQNFHARTGVELIQAAGGDQGQLKPVAKPQVSIYSPSSPKQPTTAEIVATPVDFKPMPSAENTQQVQQVTISESPAATSSIVVPQGASTLIQTQQPANAQQLQQQQPLAQVIQIQEPQPQVAQLVQVQQHSIDVQQHHHQQQQHQQLAAQVVQLQQPGQQFQIDPQQQVVHLQHPKPQEHQYTATMIQQFPGQGTAYILSPSMAPDVIEDRNSPVYANNRYVIKPQTYVTGPGGQVFTVPVPIPAGSEEEDHPHHPHPHHQQQQYKHRERAEETTAQKKSDRPMNQLMHKVIDAFSVNRKTIERVETNVALPVLATTGVLLGLGALAAGWYLSSQNREVGYLRRTGKPHVNSGSGVNLKRVRRQAPEVDQAGFFQSIIQHAIEKQQKEFEDTVEPVPSPSSSSLTVSPKRNHYITPEKTSSLSRHDESELLEKGSYGHTTVVKHHKKPVKSSGIWLGSRQALNFAKVAIPAVVLGGAVIAIAALIFGWYISGSNREIAFLEPSAYSRKKRDLTTTKLSDSWVQHLLSSIHSDPYGADGQGGGESSQNSMLTFDPDTSKGNSYGSKAILSHAVVAVSLASVAFLTMMALVVAWFFAENERTNSWLENGGIGYGGWPNHYRRARSVATNSIGGPEVASTLNPGFLASILTDLEVSQSRILKKLQENGYSKWQETPCAKRIFCDVMSTQGDDTIRAMEKRMVTFVSMLPDSLSSSLSKTLGDVMLSIHRRDCSAFTCKGHWVDPSLKDQPSPSPTQPR